MHRPAIFLAMLLAASLAGHSQAANETLQFTEKFLNSRIGYNLKHISENMQAAMAGQLKHLPVQAPKQISVSCLNSVAPEPLNWIMWCPDSHAKVTQWVDIVGSTHRRIELQPMPTMTAEMAVWFMTPMFPKTLTVDGQVFTKNHLWHPIDHKKKQDFRLSPGKTPKAPVALMNKLDETYRSPANAPGKVYKTELWVTALDLPNNLPHNRYVLGMDVMGFQVFTLIVEFNDSHDGLVVSVEIIIGAAAKGYDTKNPNNGVPASMAKAANTMILEPVMAPHRANGEFDGALDAVTRHVVEEFGNLPNFVPDAWNGDMRGKLAQEVANFKRNIITMVQKGGAIDKAAARQAGL